MKQQINEIKRMQQLAGVIEEGNMGMMSGQHGEDDFQNAVISYIKEKYSNLISKRAYDELGLAIEKDFPSLRSDLVLQDIFGSNSPEELSTPSNG